MYIKVLTVSQITNYIKRLLETDVILNKISVKGEISNFKYHYSGHMYFTLKDDSARLKCVMFKSSSTNLKFMPEDGMNVILTGSVSLYERDGQYQLYVNDMQPDGVGALYIAFEQLKRKLESEGLFDTNNKRPIPKYPSSIGVVTSATGAAVRDIINIISRRYPGMKILIAPVLVQGSGAAEQIAEAIGLLNQRKDVDIIIVGRGGGSIEELWAFNEEIVARAISKSRIPVVSAVGHETDFTIADFTSDLRAPTPSAAAEICAPDKKELIYRMNTCLNALCSLVNNNIQNKRTILKNTENIINSLNLKAAINQKKQYLDALNSKIVTFLKYKLEVNREILKKYTASLESLSPLSILTRGYSVVYLSDTKKVVSRVKNVEVGDNIDILVSDGSLKCIVKDIMEEKKDEQEN